jgi:hypothetical protein
MEINNTKKKLDEKTRVALAEIAGSSNPALRIFVNRESPEGLLPLVDHHWRFEHSHCFCNVTLY